VTDAWDVRERDSVSVAGSFGCRVGGWNPYETSIMVADGAGAAAATILVGVGVYDAAVVVAPSIDVMSPLRGKYKIVHFILDIL
jgi:hypothetical protein